MIRGNYDKEQFYDAVADHALKDDWSCVAGPADGSSSLPGLRYGASVEIKPKLFVLPCPCAGGKWGVSPMNQSLVLDTDESVRFVHPGDIAQPAGHPQTHADNASQASDDELSAFSRKPRGKTTSFNLKLIGGRAMKQLSIRQPYQPGTEPYVADYGCAKGLHRDFLSQTLLPGKRWFDTPDSAIIVVPTPCPCDLGIWTGLQSGPDMQKEATPPTSVPEWQEMAPPMLSGFDADSALTACWLGIASSLVPKPLPNLGTFL